jgi:uncharacterized cupredoxin-like copper-binding protein
MKKTLFITIVFASLVLSACGGSTAPSDTIDVTMTDFQFTPNLFTVPAGEEITVNAANNGAVVHNLIVMKLGTDVGTEFDDEDTPNVYWQVQLEPGASSTETFTAPSEVGTYQVVCSTPGHLVAGMIASMNVAAPEE